MFKNRQSLLFIGDVLMLALAFCAMVALRFNIGTQRALIVAQAHSFAFLFIFWLVIFFIFDLYNFRRVNPNPRNIGLLILALIVNTLLSIVVFYTSSNNTFSPKTNLLLVALFAFVFLVLWRRLFFNLSIRRFKRLVVLIGSSDRLSHLADEFARHPHLGEVMRVTEFDIESTIADRTNIVFISEFAQPEILVELSKLQGVEILSLAEAYRTIFAKVPLESMTDDKAVEIISTQAHAGVQFIYRVVEILFAVSVLIIMSPFLLIAMLAIWIEDRGPIFLRQQRVGEHGTLFTFYKLRTMKALSADGSAETNGAQWAMKKDPRITRVGAILRKTHIDEVPQMWNMIKGDIALVGPRPERPEFVAELEQIIPYYYLRHSIKPGFTGWAQIKFRYASTVLDSREKFEYDLYYLRSKHPLLDIGIVLKTLQIIFTH